MRLLLVLTLFLAGCSSTPVIIAPKFPDPYRVGVENKEPKCAPLQEQTGENVSMIDLLKTVVANYGLYYECSDHVDNWNKWYKEQKQNYEKVKK